MKRSLPSALIRTSPLLWKPLQAPSKNPSEKPLLVKSRLRILLRSVLYDPLGVHSKWGHWNGWGHGLPLSSWSSNHVCTLEECHSIPQLHMMTKSLLMDVFFMHCFKALGGKPPIKEGKRPIKANGLFSITLPWCKTASLKRPFKKSMRKPKLQPKFSAFFCLFENWGGPGAQTMPWTTQVADCQDLWTEGGCQWRSGLLGLVLPYLPAVKSTWPELLRVDSN